MQSKTFSLPMLHSEAQVRDIENRLRAIPGMKLVQGHPETKLFTIEWTEPASWDNVWKLLEGMGYTPDD